MDKTISPEPYYQKVVNLPLFVTAKAQTKAFIIIYKQKVVVLPLFVTFHTLLLSHNAKMGSLISRCLGADIVIRSFTIKDFLRRVTLAAGTELLKR